MLSRNTYLQNRYRIIRPLGKGGMGHVYEAIDDQLDCIVAIKETFADSDKMRRAFEREAKLLGNLRHRVLPRVTGHFFENAGQFLVMDFIEGDDLAELLRKRKRPFSYEEILAWTYELLSALEYLHSRLPLPIIHRDIKPANIKITNEDEVFLLDFGLAKGAAGQMHGVETGQLSSSVYGYTAPYAPLEQLNKSGTDARSDLYSLGATLYHLLTGKVPVTASIRYEALDRGQQDPLPAPHQVNTEIPHPISVVISQAMAMSRRDRIASAAKMRQALKEASVSIEAQRRKGVVETVSPSIERGGAEPARQGEQSLDSISANAASSIGYSSSGASAPHSGGEQENQTSSSALRTEPPTANPSIDSFPSSLGVSWPSQIGSEAKETSDIVSDSIPDARPDDISTLEQSRREEERVRQKEEAAAATLHAAAEKRRQEAEAERLRIEARAKRLKQEEDERRRRADEEARLRDAAEQERRLRAEEARRSAEEEAAQKLAAKEAARKRAEEAERKREEEERKRAEAQRRQEEEEQQKRDAEEASLRVARDERRRKEKERQLYEAEARRRREEEAAKRQQAEEEDAARQRDAGLAEELARLEATEQREIADQVRGDIPPQARDSIRGEETLVASPDIFEPPESIAASAVDTGRSVRRTWIIGGGAALLVIGLVAAAFIFLSQETKRPSENVNPIGSPTSTSNSPVTNRGDEVKTTSPAFSLKQKLPGHQGIVWSLSFSPDGNFVASASSDNKVRLWETKSWKLARSLEGHTAGVNSIAFSPDSRTLASASNDRTVRLWNILGDSRPIILDGKTDVYFVAFSTDGKLLSSAGKDKKVRLWDASSGVELKTLSGHTDIVWAVAFSPDGKILASASKDMIVKLWDTQSGAERGTLRGHTGAVICIAFSPDGKVLASGGDDNSIKLWDWQSGKEINTLTGHDGYISSIVFSPGGQTLASASEDETVRLWDIQTGKVRQTLPQHNKGATAVIFSSDGKTLLTGGKDSTIKVWR